MEYSLRQFPGDKSVHECTINGAISRIGDLISVTYTVEGRLQDIIIPEQSDSPQRRNGLWNATCFEFFIAAKNSTCYWEFNLSPSGDWNVYKFDDERKGMREEPSFNSLPIKIQQSINCLHLSVDSKLDAIITKDKEIQVAMSTVIKTISGNLFYYALSHPGPEPDFHNRKGFLINI